MIYWIKTNNFEDTTVCSGFLDIKGALSPFKSAKQRDKVYKIKELFN
jgi:hypothetical protein